MADERILAAARDALEQRFFRNRPRVCTICGGTRWSVHGVFKSEMEHGFSGRTLGGDTAPFFALVCDICGQALFFAAANLLGHDKMRELQRTLDQETQGEALLRQALGGD